MPADRDAALGFGAIRGLAEMLYLAPPLDRAGADAEEGRNFLVGALHAVQLFHFNDIDIGFRPRHGSPHLFENPQFRTPIRERQAQSLDVGIAGEKLCLDCSDFALATFDFDSYRDSSPLGRNLIERAAVAFESRLFSS
jgi:hypothetical protein